MQPFVGAKAMTEKYRSDNPVSKSQFRRDAERRAIAWKTTQLPEAARAKAPYSRHGITGPPSILCLPWAYASLNLLDTAQPTANWFEQRSIHWHDALCGGPSNHLLDSQVQCVNALWALGDDPHLVKAAFGDVLPISQVLPVEDDRFVTFEYIGSMDLLNEGAGMPRVRGSMCTSADAAIRYRTPWGTIELLLLEWKYTEDYRGHELDVARQRRRKYRYRQFWDAANCPLRRDLIPYDDLFVEPFYQLMRQQLLAQQLECRHELEADRVRVMHIAPLANDGFAGSLNRPSHRAVGGDVITVWKAMQRDPETFISFDSTSFADKSRDWTNPVYCDRYGGPEL